MRRREFIAGLGSATVWPVVAGAQTRTMPVSGFLHALSPTDVAAPLTAFHNGLRETGFVDGQNAKIEYRFAEGQLTRLPALAADLVQGAVKAIVTGGGGAPEAAKLATTTIPIVVNMAGDPVRQGLVASLNRPGGNLTGFTTDNSQLIAKRFGLLHEMVPQASSIYMLRTPTGSNSSLPRLTATGDLQERDFQRAGLSIDAPIRVVNVRNHDFDDAFATLANERAGALFVFAAHICYIIVAKSWNWRRDIGFPRATPIANSQRPEG
jgi:putative ABC transport system substrate-binding protein